MWYVWCLLGTSGEGRERDCVRSVRGWWVSVAVTNHCPLVFAVWGGGVRWAVSLGGLGWGGWDLCWLCGFVWCEYVWKGVVGGDRSVCRGRMVGVGGWHEGWLREGGS